MYEILRNIDMVEDLTPVKSLWKENLNSDGHQFHQFQQNDQSPFILIENKKLHNMTLEIPVLAWDRNRNVAVSN